MAGNPSKYENISVSSGKNPSHDKILWFKKFIDKKIKEGYRINGDLKIKDGEYIQQLEKVKK